MLGRRFPGIEPGTFAARRLGMLALASGRPDLLRAGDSINAGVGIGQVTFTLEGTLTIGDAPVMVSSAHHKRTRFRVKNITYMEADGTESSNWSLQNSGRYRPSNLNPINNEQCRLKLAFGRPATASDAEADVGETIEITEGVSTDSIWLYPVGTPGSLVRYQLEEFIDHDKG